LCRVNHCIGCIPVIRPEKHVGGSWAGFEIKVIFEAE
jgi:hypothetical protein